MIFLFFNLILIFVLFEKIRRVVKYTLPFGELIAIAFCIENSFSPSILFVFFSPQYYVQGDTNFIDYPIEKFLLFSTISSIAFAVSLQTLKGNNGGSLINDNQKYQLSPLQLFLIYLIGFIIQIFQFRELNFISNITYFIVILSLLTYDSKTKLLSYLIRFFGLFYLFIESSKSGMYGSLISGLIILFLYTTFEISFKQKKSPKIIFYYPLILLGFFTLAFSQHFKLATRVEVWEGERVTTSEAKFYDIINNNSITEISFFRPAASRLNQGWLVSLVMKKTEANNSFLYGKTIFDAVIVAIVPRIFWPNKPESGGKENIKNYTDLQLNKSTSMNIGTLGELFINFGFYAPVGLFLYGLFIRLTLITLQNHLNAENRLYYYLIPFVFLGFIGSGNDIAMQLTTYFKSFIFIFFLNKIFS
jgi:hypothetical protein